MTSKPHICWSPVLVCWLCFGCNPRAEPLQYCGRSRVGYGDTPLEAYHNWRRVR